MDRSRATQHQGAQEKKSHVVLWQFNITVPCPCQTRTALPRKTWTQVVSQVALSPSSKEYKSHVFPPDIATYCRVGHGSTHVNSKSYHLKENILFVKIHNRNFKARFGMEGENRRQTPYLANHRSQPSLRCKSPQRTLNKNLYNKGRNPRYTPSHGADLNC